MNIVIIDDHNIIIEGIEMLLSREKEITIEKTYNDGNLFLADLRTENVNPEIILMDLMMPTINGLDCAKIIKEEFPNIKIIILSMSCEPKIIEELIEKIKIEGYLSKKINREELVSALNDVSQGNIHLSQEAEKSVQDFKRKIIDYPEVRLSCREKEIVQLMIDGYTNKQIATQLFISESTVETHRKNIYRKTEAHSLPKLIQIVADLNLLDELM
jgi:two-component system NarL family response regulator